jgi:hypothetical protein
MVRVIFFLGLVAVDTTAFAQIATDGRGTSHVFPQFVDGSVPGSTISYKSTLIVSATDFGNSTSCTFKVAGVTDIGMMDARGNIQLGTVFSFVMDPGGWQVISSLSGQSLVLGSATLDCNRVVSAQLRYTLRVDGRVVSEATVSSSSPGTLLQFLADQREGARVGVAVTNPYDVEGEYGITVIDVEGRSLGSIVVRLAPGTSVSGFIDEIVRVPTDNVDLVLVQSNTAGIEAFALGLRFTGEAFSTVPPTVRLP